MSTMSAPSRRGRWASARDFFWLLDLCVLVLLAFFLALGAFGLGDSTVLTALIAVLGIAYVAHVVLQRRADDGHPDPADVRERERRGF